MKKNLSTILLVAVLIVGVGLLVYPSLSDYWNSFHQSRAIASYVETVEGMSQEEMDALLEEARAEFLRRTAEGYTCPIPPEAVPTVAE